MTSVAAPRVRPPDRAAAPRGAVGRSGRAWLVVAAVSALIWVVADVWTSFGDWLEDGLAALSLDAGASDAAVDAARILTLPAALWVVRAERAVAIVALLVMTSWRRLVTAILAILGAALVAELATAVGVPDPVTDAPGPAGWAQSSAPITATAASLLVLTYAVVPVSGRRAAFSVVGALTAAVVVGQTLLGAVTLADLLAAPVAAAVVVVLFQVLAPDDLFPVGKVRGGAHLAMDERRTTQVRSAIEDRFGWQVHELKPFGGSSSLGSTPLRADVTMQDGDRRHVFAKLYSERHLRSDRQYKLVRTVLYGELEDEGRFESVQRLAEYEDYLMAAAARAGVPAAQAFGLAEVVPGREYLVISEFFDGSHELGDAEIDGAIVDQGLDAVRTMWDGGLAHRDVKPANLLVHEGRLVLIDFSFGQLLPTWWRRSVDLANMMLALGLRADPAEVYRRAQERFTDDELGLAFACVQGPAVPSQLQRLLAQRRSSGDDVLATFRAMAPACEPVKVSRWSLRRVGLVAALVVVLLVVLDVVGRVLSGASIL